MIVFDKDGNGVLIEIGRLRPKHILFDNRMLTSRRKDVDLPSNIAQAMSHELTESEAYDGLESVKLGKTRTVGDFVAEKCEQARSYAESAMETYKLRKLTVFAVVSVADQLIVKQVE